MFLRVNNKGEVKQRRSTKKTKKGAPRSKEGILYILKMYLGDKNEMECVYKIGITARKTRPLETRMAEIATDHYQKFRYMPYIEPRKFKKTPYYFELEAHMHQKFKDCQYVPEKKFDGSTELFIINDEAELISYYNTVMENPLDYITPNKGTQEVQEPTIREVSDSKKAVFDTYGLS